MNFWTDTHAHLYSSEFDNDRDAIMERATAASVEKLYLPNVDHTSIDGMMNLEARHPETCHAMMGLHPCSVKNDFEKELYQVEQWLSKRTFAAVGEIGTDLYWDKTFWEQQKEAFTIQVNLAKKYKLPVVIHCRQSIDETIQLIEPLATGNLSGIFHCFTGTVEQARKITAMGFYLGIGGVVTFKNGGLDKVLPEIGMDKLVLETDSPYLAPVPYRAKRNEPSYIPIIATKVAEIKKIPLEEVREETSGNAAKVFGRKKILDL